MHWAILAKSKSMMSQKVTAKPRRFILGYWSAVFFYLFPFHVLNRNRAGVYRGRAIGKYWGWPLLGLRQVLPLLCDIPFGLGEMDRLFPKWDSEIALWVMIGLIDWYFIDVDRIVYRCLYLGDYYMVKISSSDLFMAFMGLGYLGYKKAILFYCCHFRCVYLIVLSGLLFTG